MYVSKTHLCDLKKGKKNAKSLQCDNDVVTKVRDVTINLIFGFFMHDQ